MRRGLMVAAAWVAGTALSILVAHAAVGAVRGRVVDRPQALFAPTNTTLPAGTPSTTVTPPDVSTTSAVPTTTLDVGVPPTRPIEEGGEATAATTTTTLAPPPAPGEIKTYSTNGGTVSIEVYPDHMTLLGAVPAPGYSVAEQELSADKIEIEFKSRSKEIHFKARLEDGAVVTTIEGEEEHGGEHGGED